ncbi:glycosyltransferase family 2 protein [Mycobacterium lehmannii]|uniref:glycosyltransferase family 2 protein n=1 Tax=Mycobacterium lehmannii TaxID=2048550 RepID=UPI000B941949|nr:glycosyltransferase [Mycobacterium lehmannii]
MNEQTQQGTPKVSVVSVTYNHEAYIRDALNGFVAQKTDFPVEVIVADDGSTDASPAIIRDYATRYPELFRPILRSKNVGVNANTKDALSSARGEYVALCDGDDYWTDPMKLSKQAAFLDEHPDIAVCFHPVRTIWTAGDYDESTKLQDVLRTLERVVFPEFPPFFWAGDMSLNTLISRNFIQTNAAMYRRLDNYGGIPADVMPLDWFLHVWHGATGGIAMLSETMGIYRRHPKGIWWDATVNPAKFWQNYGPGHLATLEAMLDLFPDDPVREAIIAKNASRFLGRIAHYVPGETGHALLYDLVQQHPRIAMLALRHRSSKRSRAQVDSRWQTMKAVVKDTRRTLRLSRDP